MLAQPKLDLSLTDGLTDIEVTALLYDWRTWAREKQLPPDHLAWSVWLILAGRGFGKTRTGVEVVRDRVERNLCGRIALVAPTAGDARDVMVEGESGILACSRPSFMPLYEPSKRRITWPNGAIATLYSADEPERLRGPQHDFAWCDEMASWRYLMAWDMLMFGLRLGHNPQAVITTTPKPLKILRELMKDPGTALTSGSTFENAENLAASFIDKIKKKYENTRLGQQELYAMILDDNPGALWNRRMIESARLQEAPFKKFDRVVVAVDPNATAGEDSDECGIIVAARRGDHAYILADVTPGAVKPDVWGKAAVSAYRGWKADRIVAEVNNGGDMVESVIRVCDPNASYKEVRATRGKKVRAEPIAALYEQGRVHHIGYFGALEDQMCEYDPNISDADSPDRMDALVWALTELMLAPTTDGLLTHMRSQHQAKEEARERELANG